MKMLCKMIAKKKVFVMSAIILASIVAVPSMVSNSFADKDIENEIHFECNYEGSGNGDNIPAFAGQANSNLPLTGTGGPGAAGTSGATTSNAGNSGNDNGASTATGGSGGSSSIGDNDSEQSEANIDVRNPCILESNVISIDED